MPKRNRSEDHKDEISASAAVKEETNIMEMNSDCLRRVFDMLSLRDLLNFALAIRKNKRIDVVLNDILERLRK